MTINKLPPSAEESQIALRFYKLGLLKYYYVCEEFVTTNFFLKLFFNLANH